ncbi:MAG: peroxide stress protein YaaA, partial [Gammaproteobacteria bacterium]
GGSLYDYWRGAITTALKDELSAHKERTVINLASNEYFKAVDERALGSPVIQPVFKEKTGGGYKLISFYAKKARGLMAHYMIKERIDKPEGLKSFDLEGYSFNSQLSTDSNWTFTRTS